MSNLSVKPVVWDVYAEGVYLGYFEAVNDRYSATSAKEDFGSPSFPFQTDAEQWLLSKMQGGGSEAPRRAGDRKGDIE